MFSKSKRFGDSIHAASGPGPATYKIKRHFDNGSTQQPKRVKKPQALPMLLGKKPLLCKNSSKVESKNATTDSNDWSGVFACNDLLATGATGMVFSGTLKAQGTRVALKRILNPKCAEKTVNEFFREFAILKACQHLNIVTVFSAYEVPNPAFIMELLGRTLDKSTQEKEIDNHGVLVAFSNAAAAVQYLHSVSIAHRDIKPHNLCHQVDCHSWEVKLIDFDAAEELKESCWVCPTSILRF